MKQRVCGVASAITVCPLDAAGAHQAALKQAIVRCPVTDGYGCCPNALAERVNGVLKDEFLFVLPDDPAPAPAYGCLLADPAGHRCNQERPRLALNHLTPDQVHLPGKTPLENSNGARALFLSTNSRTRQLVLCLTVPFATEPVDRNVA